VSHGDEKHWKHGKHEKHTTPVPFASLDLTVTHSKDRADLAAAAASRPFLGKPQGCFAMLVGVQRRNGRPEPN
jgi:hypothetical protein